MVEALRDPGTDAARLAPWCPAILEASIAFEIDPYVLCGVLLRESRAGWGEGYEPKGNPRGWGDGGFAWSPWQIDRRFHAMFVRSPEAGDPRAQTFYAAELLAEARDHFRRYFPSAPASLISDAMIAAYNAGVGRIDVALRTGRRPDELTTGHDYASDVQRRAADLRSAHPHLFAPRPAEVA